MIDVKVLKEIDENTQEAIYIMTTLQAMRKRKMKYDVDQVMRVIDKYEYLCEEIKRLINEN